MDDGNQSVESATWTAPSEVTADSLCRAVVALGGRIEASSDAGVEARFGSRLTYRLLGAWTPGGLRRLPLRLRVTTEHASSGETAIHAALYDDKGWYVRDTNPLHARALTQRSAQILQSLREASGTSPGPHG